MDELIDVPREDTFEVVVRGYNKRQVHEYMTRARRQVRELEEKLARAQETIDSMRVELQSSPAPVMRPAHEEVSGRLSEILRLADEEAATRRSKAESEVTKLRELADEDANRIVEEARQQAVDILSTAKSEVDREATQAREESKRLLRSSTEKAQRTLSDAQKTAQALLDQTGARANAINEVLSQRLSALTTAHADAVSRLQEMRSVVVHLLDNEEKAGSLTQAVEAAVAATKAPAPVSQAPAAAVIAETAEVTPVSDPLDMSVPHQAGAETAS